MTDFFIFFEKKSVMTDFFLLFFKKSVVTDFFYFILKKVSHDRKKKKKKLKLTDWAFCDLRNKSESPRVLQWNLKQWILKPVGFMLILKISLVMSFTFEFLEKIIKSKLIKN